MLLARFILSTLMLAIPSTVNAFGVASRRPASLQVFDSCSIGHFPTSTCLKAEADEEQAADEPKEVTSDASADIMNSPTFLKRKLEVLESDLAKAEADVEEAKARLAEGKAEWGSQLDELDNEVSK
jgi:hypothetical protein